MSESEQPSPVLPGDPAVDVPMRDKSTATRAMSKPRVWALALAAGVLAGLGAFAIGEATNDAFPLLIERPARGQQASGPPPMVMGREGMRPATGRELGALAERAAVHRSVTKAAMVAFGALGGLTGLALGLAGGLARRSWSRALVAGLVGMVIGGLGCAAASRALFPIQMRAADIAWQSERTQEIFVPVLYHGGVWLIVGLAGGLALGLGLGGSRVPSAILGGLVGAALATILYDFVGGIALPDAETANPLATERSGRALAHFSVAVLTVAAATLTAMHLSFRRAAGPKSPEA